jgi:mxaD protein
LKRILAILAVACIVPLSAQAHGPSGQKVIKEVVVHAAPAKVWTVMKDFASIGQWHPNVTDVKVEEKKDEASGTTMPFRVVKLKNGRSFEEKLREVDDENMKLDYKMVEGDNSTILVYGYRTVLYVKPGPTADEATVSLTARFYNKSNSLEQFPGLGNKEANEEINALYDAAGEGLQKFFK